MKYLERQSWKQRVFGIPWLALLPGLILLGWLRGNGLKSSAKGAWHGWLLTFWVKLDCE